MATEQKQIRLRRDTAARWQQNNPVLAAGELGVDIDNGYARLGTNGTQHFLDVDPFLTFDPATGALPGDVLSFLDGRTSRSNGAVTVTPYMSPDGSYEYEVITVRAAAGGMNSVIEKVYTNDYEKTWTGGTFSPPLQPFVNFQTQANGYVITSGDAFQGGQMSGLQIKHGVVYGPWGNYSNDPRVGKETIALMRDGTWQVFRVSSNPDPQTLIDAGVDTTWGFGPLVVVDGAVRPDIGDSSIWTDWVTSLSARNFLGYNAAGDLIIITVKGKTGVSGIAGVEMGNVALRHGCVNAIMLDGGGSVQGRSGYLFHPSTDAGNNRDVANAIAIHVPLLRPIVVEPTAVPYGSGFAATSGQTLTARKNNGETRLRGTAQMTNVAANTWYTAGTLQERFRPGWAADSWRGTVFNVSSGYAGMVSISPTDGTIQVKLPVAATGTSYWQFDAVRFDAAY